MNILSNKPFKLQDMATFNDYLKQQQRRLSVFSGSSELAEFSYLKRNFFNRFPNGKRLYESTGIWMKRQYESKVEE